jgi:hypothetical protein
MGFEFVIEGWEIQMKKLGFMGHDGHNSFFWETVLGPSTESERVREETQIADFWSLKMSRPTHRFEAGLNALVQLDLPDSPLHPITCGQGKGRSVKGDWVG